MPPSNRLPDLKLPASACQERDRFAAPAPLQLWSRGPHATPSCRPQEAAAQLCSLGSAGGPFLLAALQAGEARARSALAAIWWGSCSSPSTQQFVDAYRAFLDSTELYDTSRVMG